MKQYDYYIGLDWSQAKMAIAISQKSSDESRVVELDSDVCWLKYLLKSLKGTKVLTLEESTASQWLWVELYDHADEIIVCDPYHNFLLSSGPKNDRIDAGKLLELLRGVLVKHHKMSGSRSYGSRSPRKSSLLAADHTVYCIAGAAALPRCNRTLKSVFKTAAFSCAYGRGENSMKDYFNSLIARGKPVHTARHMVARKIAATALAIMKSGKQYNST